MARPIANPGCYPTAVELGFRPPVYVWASTYSGFDHGCESRRIRGGATCGFQSLFSEASENVKAYGVSGHCHLPDIRQGLAQMAGASVGLAFVPHLTPMIRGVHATLYGRLTMDISDEELQLVFESAYEGEPFVDVIPFLFAVIQKLGRFVCEYLPHSQCIALWAEIRWLSCR